MFDQSQSDVQEIEELRDELAHAVVKLQVCRRNWQDAESEITKMQEEMEDARVQARVSEVKIAWLSHTLDGVEVEQRWNSA